MPQFGYLLMNVLKKRSNIQKQIICNMHILTYRKKREKRGRRK